MKEILLVLLCFILGFILGDILFNKPEPLYTFVITGTENGGCPCSWEVWQDNEIVAKEYKCKP